MKTNNIDKLNKYRNEIDLIDDKIFGLLKNRFEYVGYIKQIKGELKLPNIDLERENEIFVRLSNMPADANIKRAILQIFKKIIEMGEQFQLDEM